MKHAAILYTCIGLMGTAAVAGFVDYTHASKAGLLNDLYAAPDTAVTHSIPAPPPPLDEAYSRAPLEEARIIPDGEKTFAFGPQPKKPRKKKLPPPPPPPAPAPPPPPPRKKKIAPPPPPELVMEDVMPGAPPAAEKIEAATLTPPEVVEVKEISVSSFSRAPLRKVVAKGKKQ